MPSLIRLNIWIWGCDKMIKIWIELNRLFTTSYNFHLQTCLEQLLYSSFGRDCLCFHGEYMTGLVSTDRSLRGVETWFVGVLGPVLCKCGANAEEMLTDFKLHKIMKDTCSLWRQILCFFLWCVCFCWLVLLICCYFIAYRNTTHVGVVSIQQG